MSEGSQETRSSGFLMGNLVVVGSMLLIFFLMLKLSIVAHLNITTSRAIAHAADKGSLFGAILVGSLPSSAGVLFGTASLVVISRAVTSDKTEHIFAIYLCALTVLIAMLLSSWIAILIDLVLIGGVIYVYRTSSSWSNRSLNNSRLTKRQILFGRVLRFALAVFVVINSFQIILNDGPPFPTMIISKPGSTSFTGYILKDDGDQVWILRDDTRLVEVQSGSDVTKRPCQAPKHKGIVYSGPIELYGDHFFSPSGYPSCP
jgi:hypothetical protein